MALAAGRCGRAGVPPGLGPLRTAPPRFPEPPASTARSRSAAGCTPAIAAKPAAWAGGPTIPDADINFSIRLSELTKTHISKQPDGEPNHLVVRLTDDALFNCPMIQMEDVGTMRFSEIEVVRLREYLLKGGFLYVDDFWGECGVGAVGRGDRPRAAAKTSTRSST